MRLNRQQFLELVGCGAAASGASASFGCATTTGEETAAAPGGEEAAKFSVPFLMSAIILERRAGLREFTDEYVMSPRAQQMMQRVTGVRDEGIEKQGFDKIRSTVEVDLVDGRKLVQPADERYRGGPENPFTREDLRAKFDDCAGRVLPPNRLAPAFAAIETVDKLPNVRQLIQALAART